MSAAVSTIWLGLITLVRKCECVSDKLFDLFLTLTFRLLHCKHPARDFRCDRRPWAIVDIAIIQGSMKCSTRLSQAFESLYNIKTVHEKSSGLMSNAASIKGTCANRTWLAERNLSGEAWPYFSAC
jgi:hypothetical protein